MWVELRSWTGWAASLANLARWTQKSLPLSVQLSLWCKLNCTDCFLHATSVQRTLWRLLVMLEFTCLFRCAGIGQCCVRLWGTSSRPGDHSSNFFPLQGLMFIHSDAYRIRQVSCLCPWCRCSKVYIVQKTVMKENRQQWLLSRHNWAELQIHRKKAEEWDEQQRQFLPSPWWKMQTSVSYPFRIIQSSTSVHLTHSLS